jgi:hypothetical protein
MRPIAITLVLVGMVAACSTSSSSSSGDGGLGCSLGDKCSPTQLCNGGIPGCGSNCQCLDGTWQAPCPADLPETGSPCSPENAYCGYTTSTNPCGADNCYCQGGAWSCGPTCTVPLDSGGQPSDASGTPESGSPSDGGGDGSLRYAVVIRLGQNDECGEPLPTDSSGETTCAIVLEGPNRGCEGPGLSPATPQEIALVVRDGSSTAGSICNVTQLAGSPGVGCDQQAMGWCYVAGSCESDAGTSCAAAICTTSAFNDTYVPASGEAATWVAYLVCP